MKKYTILLILCLSMWTPILYAGGLSSQNLGLRPQKISKSERHKNNSLNDVKIPNASQNNKINWSKELNLDETQQQYLQKIHEENLQKKREIVEQIKDLYSQFDELRTVEEQQIRSILDEKQKIKMDKIIQRNNRHKQGKENVAKPSRKRMRTYGLIETAE